MFESYTTSALVLPDKMATGLGGGGGYLVRRDCGMTQCGRVGDNSAAGAVLPAGSISRSSPSAAFNDPGVDGVRGLPCEDLTPCFAGRCGPSWPELENGPGSHDSFQIVEFGRIDRRIALRFLDID